MRESESEEEQEEDDAKSRKTNKSERRKEKRESSRRQSSMAWLQENDEDNPLDLLDPMAIKSVLSTRPKSGGGAESKAKAAKNGGFKISADGKLVIDDDDDESSGGIDNDVKSKASRKSRQKNDDIEEMMDTLSITKKSTTSASGKAKQKRRFEDDSDEDFGDAKSKFSYKSGGTGIHRSLSSAQSKKTSDHASEYRAKVYNYLKSNKITSKLELESQTSGFRRIYASNSLRNV